MYLKLFIEEETHMRYIQVHRKWMSENIPQTNVNVSHDCKHSLKKISLWNFQME